MPDNRILEFVTGGPQNYAYRIARPDRDGNTTICKVRGITFNYKNSLAINFDTIKDMVINNRDDVKTVRDDYKILRPQETTYRTSRQRLQDSLRQRVVMQDYSTRPYGF